MGPTAFKTKSGKREHCELDLCWALGKRLEPDLERYRREICESSLNSPPEYNRPSPLRESTDYMIVCQSFCLFVIDF